MTLLSIPDAAKHVESSRWRVQNAIRSGKLPYVMMAPTDPSVCAKQVKGVDVDDLELWAQSDPIAQHRDILYDYQFFVDRLGMGDEEARQRLADGYQVTYQVVWGAINKAAA